MSMANSGLILGFLAESSRKRAPTETEYTEIDPAIPRPVDFGAYEPQPNAPAAPPSPARSRLRTHRESRGTGISIHSSTNRRDGLPGKVAERNDAGRHILNDQSAA